MAKTRADHIVHRLTQSILTRALPPGSPIDEMQLAQSFGASRTPIREALRQLAASGLVELRPHRAPRVAAMDGGKLAEMFDVMAELEALCASRACLEMTARERRALEAHHADMAASVRDGDVAAYRLGNVAFHGMIYDGARNAYLRQLAASTRERLAPYRGVQLEAPARLARSYAEHHQIVTAILRADRAAAAAAMRHHLALTEAALDRLARAAGLDEAPDHDGVNAVRPDHPTRLPIAS